MRRILFVSDRFDAYGAEKMMLWVGNTLAIKGYNVTFCSVLGVRRFSKIVNQAHSVELAINPRNRIEYLFKTFLHLRKLIKYNKYEYVVSFAQNSYYAILLLKFLLKFKIVLSERNDPFTMDSFFNNLKKRLYQYSDSIVFQTEGAQSYFGKKVVNKSVIIPNPIQIPEDCWSLRYAEKIIINVARLDVAYKGQDVLLKAFSQVSPKYPDYLLYFCGDGHDLEFLQKKARELGIVKKVKFLGKVDNIFEVLLKSRVFVLSSRSEGIPNALMESLAIGIPSISTDCSPGGARLLIKNRENGIIVEVNNDEALANAIIEIIEDDDMSIRLGQIGRESMRNYSPEIIINSWARLFQ